MRHWIFPLVAVLNVLFLVLFALDGVGWLPARLRGLLSLQGLLGAAVAAYLLARMPRWLREAPHPHIAADELRWVALCATTVCLHLTLLPLLWGARTRPPK